MCVYSVVSDTGASTHNQKNIIKQDVQVKTMMILLVMTIGSVDVYLKFSGVDIAHNFLSFKIILYLHAAI